jgi:exocyst complex component 8
MANESRRRITPAMELDNKKSHRQSRAPWISGAAKANNPYAAANTSAISGDNQSLQVPSNPHGISNTSRKNTRRLSIHASAAAHSLGRSSSQNAPFDATSLPPVPRLPNHSNKPDGEDQKDEFMNIEKKIFQDLANGTAAEVDDYYNLLIKQKALITRDIKTNINQNQKNILQLTNDLKETQDELLQLRITTKDLYEVLDHFKESAQRRLDVELEIPSQQSQNQPKLQAQKRKDRSSILVLEKMWQSELQSLFKHVEGASKYIQPLPGRHVLAESGRWQEINIGTWKPIKPAHLFVLNDLLLMATKKSSQDGGGSKSRLHAVQCWPLSQVLLEEIQAPNQKAEDAKSYIINIKSKSLSYVYQTDRYDHYLKIMRTVSGMYSHRNILQDSVCTISDGTTETFSTIIDHTSFYYSRVSERLPQLLFLIICIRRINYGFACV